MKPFLLTATTATTQKFGSPASKVGSELRNRAQAMCRVQRSPRETRGLPRKRQALQAGCAQTGFLVTAEARGALADRRFQDTTATATTALETASGRPPGSALPSRSGSKALKKSGCGWRAEDEEQWLGTKAGQKGALYEIGKATRSTLGETCCKPTKANSDRQHDNCQRCDQPIFAIGDLPHGNPPAPRYPEGEEAEGGDSEQSTAR